jgi:hypothetical protein
MIYSYNTPVIAGESCSGTAHGREQAEESLKKMRKSGRKVRFSDGCAVTQHNFQIEALNSPSLFSKRPQSTYLSLCVFEAAVQHRTGS